MRTGGITLFLLLPVVGLIASILGYLDFRSGGSLCPSIVSVLDCSRVYVIPQARLLGVHLSEVAPLYFLALLTTAVLGTVYARWELLVVYMAFSIAGLSVIPYLVYLELVVAGALCLYCTIMHVAIVGCTAHSIALWARLHRVVG
jgi:uncharacterized membrane protein